MLYSCKFHKTISKEEVLKASKSAHMQDRVQRFANVMQVDAHGKAVATFECDTGHAEGLEYHIITDNAIIYVVNKKKFEAGENALVTVMFSRPGQIHRYFNMCNRQAPSNLLKKAAENVQFGRNHCDK